jgi:hypothetical protein
MASCYVNIIDEDVRHTNCQLLDKLNANVDDIREDVKTLVNHIESISKFDNMRSTIPPDPDRDAYKNIRFWDKESLHTYTPLEGEVKLTVFLEYENGQRIPQALVSKINEELRAYWDDMLHKEGEVPQVWTKVGLKQEDNFRTTFGG